MMKRLLQQLSCILLVLTAVKGSALPVNKMNDLYVSNYENVLGTSMEIKIAANTDQNAAKAENATLAEVDRLNKNLSGYDPSSEFNRWIKADKKAITISPELFMRCFLFLKYGGLKVMEH